MVMGANIGTSVTNTIVSFTQIGNKEEFERSFSCAVLHDMFNWLSVIFFLTLEVCTGYLNHLTSAIVQGFHISQGNKPPDMLKVITKPLAKLVIQIDKNVLKGWTTNSSEYFNVTTLLKSNCKRKISNMNHPLVADEVHLEERYQCGYLFANWGIPDVYIGLILLFISFVLLTTCLVLLVKILNSLMANQMTHVITKALNSDIPKVPWLTGYVAIVVGAIITFLVQSSSVFTSTLTPLVGAGLFKLETAYPLTLGSNIGTTTTGLLASLAADGSSLKNSLRIALCHLFFNISGIILFYPIPWMRWPIPMAKCLGRTVAEYR